MKKKIIQLIIATFIIIIFSISVILSTSQQYPYVTPSDATAVANLVALWQTEYVYRTQTITAAGGYAKFQQTQNAWGAQWHDSLTQAVTAAGGPTAYYQTEELLFIARMTEWVTESDATQTQMVLEAGGLKAYKQTQAAYYTEYQATSDANDAINNSVNATLFAPTMAMMATRAAAGEDPQLLFLTVVPESTSTSYAFSITPTPKPLLNPAAITNPATTSVPGNTPTQPVIDWYSLPFIGNILTNLKALGGVELVIGVVGALIGMFITLIVKNLERLASLLRRLLGYLFAILRRRGKDYEFEQEYLNWLIGQYRHQGLLPAQVIARRWGERQQFVDLEKIFVQVPLSGYMGNSKEQNGGKKYSWRNDAIKPVKTFKNIILYMLRFIVLRQSWRDAIVNSNFFFDPPYPVGSIGWIIDDNNRLILRGDPGSGKTTLTRYVAITCARALRNNKKEHDSRFLVRRRLLWTRTPFPILVRLSKYSDVTGWKSERTLIDTFMLELPVDLRRRCPEGFFERQLRDRPCLVFLDAYDELGSPAARSVMAEYIKGFLDAYEKPKHRIVVTTRIVGYEGQLNKYGFQICTLPSLQDGEVRALVKQRYQAITIVEKLGKDPLDSRAIENRLKERANMLIKKIEENSRLRQLANNPMLLALIVLVHFLKVELPDERVLLYRDCVEILTERWQRYKDEDDGVQSVSRQELNLTQKITLLRKLAFAMQLHRVQESKQTLISRKAALIIVTAELKDLSPNNSPESHPGDQMGFEQQAREWIDGIQAESGILVEQGLDVDGEPLIGFSHLIFQEYLAALEIFENPDHVPHLWDNLVNPAWREVVRLYVVLVGDATEIITKLSECKDSLEGAFLAGECLTEMLRKMDGHIRENVIERLKGIFVSGSLEDGERAIKILGLIATNSTIQFIAEQIKAAPPEKQVFAIRALENIRASDEFDELVDCINKIRVNLIWMLDMDYSVETKIAAREILSLIGDPRFESGIPLLISVPEIEDNEKIKRYNTRAIQEIKANTAPIKLYKNLLVVFRNADLCYFRFLRKITHPLKKSFLDGFEISRYPITNIEYCRFLEETGYKPPSSWREGTFPAEKATHPAVGISPADAREYCAWLSKKTGDDYRLPLSWEWEAAAGSLEENIYPWGNELDLSKCNIADSKIGDTTPVGIYFDVKSPYGGQDFWGNVWEYVIYPRLIFPLIVAFLFIMLGIRFAQSLPTIWHSLSEELRLLNLYGNIGQILTLKDPAYSISMFVAILILTIALALFITLGILLERCITSWDIGVSNKRVKNINRIIASVYEITKGLSWRIHTADVKNHFRGFSLRKTDDIGFRIVRQKK